MRNFTATGAGVGLALGLATAAGAATIQLPSYGSVGSQNLATYSFTAAATGHIVAYYTGSTGSDAEWLGMESGPNAANLTLSPVTGLENHLPDHSNPLALGASLDFGLVNAGDTLVFYIQDLNPGRTTQRFYSDKSLNTNDLQTQHIYSTTFTVAAGDTLSPGGIVVPAGLYTYVGFEDLPSTDPSQDWNYHDETFIFTDVATNAPPQQPGNDAVPEPATWGLMLVGFGGLGAMMRRARAAGSRETSGPATA